MNPWHNNIAFPWAVSGSLQCLAGIILLFQWLSVFSSSLFSSAVFFEFFGQCCENCPCPHVVFFSIYCYITNSLPVDLMAQLVGELHRHRRGHGFKSRSGNLVSRTSPLEIGRGGKQFQREKPWEQGCVLAWVFIQAIISQQLKLCL